MAQQEHGDYCPFLNRTDDRCSNHFQLDHLGEAFEHCFGGYHACTIYQELLRERQDRRAAAAADSRITDRWNWTPPPRASYAPKTPARSLVQLTIARRFDFAEAAD